MVDVLIVGAGPTGLVLASELTRYGVSVRIIDKNKGPVKESRALATQARVLELFTFMGISDQLIEKGKPIDRMEIFSNGNRLGEILFDQLQTPYPYLLSLPQYELERVLVAHLERQGMSVDRETEMVEFAQSEDQVIAKLASGEEVSARYLVGCDGAHSFVRKALGMGFAGKSFSETISIADVKVKWKLSHDHSHAFWQREGVFAAIPLPKEDFYRLIFASDAIKGVEDVQQAVRGLVDEEAIVSDEEWITCFKVNSRLVKEYRHKRVFLAGDAAHINSPVGGQGANAGCQDAYNLAWKLAFVLQGKGAESLLESYHLERHAIAKELLHRTEAATHMVTLKSNWRIFLRDLAMRLFLRFPWLQNKMVEAMSQIGLVYPRSRWIKEGGHFKRGPRPGLRMPNLTIHSPDGAIELFDLFKGLRSYVLILLLDEGANLNFIEGQLEEIGQLEVPVQVVPIFANEQGSGDYFDRDRALFDLLGVANSGCYLVRPDTTIAYRQAPIDMPRLMAFLSQQNP
ncbi:MAG: 6-methylpretetramide 4-monooxygenase [Chlamydiia bacterium]|nr:6-methylpretetramide 4-monooxygenase [Chlamydiia bacterium]